MNRAYAFISEVGTTLVDLVLPRSISRRLLPQTDHFAPHKGTGFEGWYTRIQGEDFSMVIIMCSLEAQSHQMTRQHYLHFSLVPLLGGGEEACVVKKKIELHLFPEQIAPLSIAPGQLPFTLDAPGFGVFICQPEIQTYELRLLDEEGGCFYDVNVSMTDRVPLDLEDDDLNCAPHGSFARLHSILPLHWGIFSTSSKANISIRRTWVGSGVVERGSEIVLEAVGRAHMEKNWGVSFPQGWTWSQASSNVPPTAKLPNLSVALAGGMILGNKAMMVHYRSPRHNWIFGPPYTVILSIPSFIYGLLWTGRLAGKRGRERRSIQWGPFASESYNNVDGVLNVDVQDFTRKLGITVRATEPPSTGTWLSLYCPLPGGHATTAYETFTATMNISAFTRKWPFGSWKLAESYKVPYAALEFGGAYWDDSAKERHLD